MKLRNWKRLIFSIRFRLLSLFIVIFGLNLTFFSFFLYRTFIQNHQAEFDAALYNYSVDVAQAIDVGALGEIHISSDLLATSEKIFPFSLSETLVQIRSLEGHSLARSASLKGSTLPFSRHDARELFETRSAFRTMSARALGIGSEPPENDLARARRQGNPQFAYRGVPDSKPFSKFRMVDLLIDRPSAQGLILQVAVPMLLIEREKRGLITFFFFSVPMVLLTAAIGGLYLSRKALQPFNAIVAKAREISPRSLSERVPIPETEDEIRTLAVTLNALLDRIETTFRSQETFLADASHQLKTPLAILRGELDWVRSSPSGSERSPSEIRGVLESASQEVENMSHLVEDMLTLARIDGGEAAVEQKPVRLDEIVIEQCSRLEPLAKDKGAKLVLNLSDSTPGGAPSFEVSGDQTLIRNVVENLIENGIKYSTQIQVLVEDFANQVVVRVKDNGPGISSLDLAKIFDRFYRAKPLDGKPQEGSGLGLSIAKRIVEAHRGRLEVESVVGQGSEFRAVFPKSGEAGDTHS